MATLVVDRSPHRGRWLHAPPGAATVAGAWALLVGVQFTGAADPMDHDALLGPRGALAVTGLLQFLAGWSAMVVAMMIPATWLVPGRRSSAALESRPSPAGFLVGLLLVWAPVGVTALVFDSSVHRAVHGIPALESRPWLVTAAALALAGMVQLLPSTARHLARAARGQNADATTPSSGFVAGRTHGVRCLRADGPLMLVMFASGGALAWMAGLTVVMVAERHARWGRAVAIAAGSGLVAAAILTALLSA